MSWKDRLLENQLVYRLWQAPFVAQKLAPMFRANDPRAFRRVLDVGCGPGTNTAHFLHTDYLGLDINPEYVAYAKARYGKEFVVADATTYTAPEGRLFDAILMNSFLHHVDDAGTARILSHLATLLTPEGRIHILDLVLPDNPGIARFLALHDRGHHARPLGRWRELFGAHFAEERFEPYPLKLFGLPPVLWNMVYFKGARRSS